MQLKWISGFRPKIPRKEKTRAYSGAGGGRAGRGGEGGEEEKPVSV